MSARRVTHLYDGFVAGPDDLLNQFEAAMDALGSLGGLFTGAQALQSVDHPLTATTDGFWNVTVAGTPGQVIICPDSSGRPRRIDELPEYTIPVPVPISAARIDYVCGQHVELDADGEPCSTETPGTPQTLYAVQGTSPNVTLIPIAAAVGALGDGTAYRIAQTAQLIYVEGAEGGGPPSVPAGYTALVQITAPVGRTLHNTDIAIVPPTFPSALFAQIAGYFPFLTVPQADPTGTNDSGPAINTVLASAASTGVRRVMLQGGSFKIITPLVIPSNVTLEGAGSDATVLLQGSTSNDVVQLGANTGPSLRNLSIEGMVGAFAGYGISSTGATGVVLVDVLVTGCWLGINVAGGNGWLMIGVRVLGSTNDGCDIASWTGNLVQIACDFSQNGGNGERFTSPAGSGMGALIVGTRFAQNNIGAGSAAGLQFDSGIKGVQTAGCRFGQELPSPPSTQAYGVAFMGSNDDITIDGVINANANAPVLIVGTLGANVVIRANGYQPAASYQTISFTSGVPWVNNYGVPVQVFLAETSTTVTEVDVSGNKVLSAIATDGTTSVFVGPGRTLAVIFSGGSVAGTPNPQ